MSKNLIIQNIKEAVKTIIINRPEKKNALDPKTALELGKALEDARDDKNIRVIIITGSGDSFCSGADLTSRDGLGEDDFGRDAVEKKVDDFQRLIRLITTTPKPVIAKVRGVSVGFGCDLALACELRYVSENAKFSQKFVRVGLIPDGGGSFTLPRLVGLARTFDLVYTGRMVEAKEAKEIGLVNEVFSDETLDNEVEKIAFNLMNGPIMAMGRAKKAIYHGLISDLDSNLRLEKNLQLECLFGEEFLEGLQAFIQKREPEFYKK